MKVLKRIVDNGLVVGYLVEYNNSQFAIKVEDTCKYVPNNVIRRSDGKWVGKKGVHIQNVELSSIQRRNNSAVGKPRVIYTSAYGKLFSVQKKLLNLLEVNNFVEIVKEDNMKVTMIDLSSMTAVTGIEYALFSKGSSKFIFKGTKTHVIIDEDMMFKLVNSGYKWVGHTHPGDQYFCLMPSDGDIQVLGLFKQEESVIFNSVGQYRLFGKDKEA